MPRLFFSHAKHEDEATSSARRGGQSPPQQPAGPEVPPPKPRRPARVLDARSATIILLVVYLGVEAAGGVLLGAAAAIQVHGPHTSQQIRNAVDRMAPVFTLINPLLGILAMIWMSRTLTQEALRDTGPTGGAWVAGRATHVVLALALGLVVGLCAHALNQFARSYVPRLPFKDFVPLVSMMRRPNPWPWLAVSSALLLGPTFEELLFRGLLYGGYRKSFGPTPAALITTALFVALHVPASFRLPIALLGVAWFAAAALWCRLRFRAIGPAIAVHVGYNAVVALFVLSHNTGH
jgi:membrane protease YdiL (CAAX protease family)